MRVLNAIPNMAGSFLWQSPFRDNLPEDRQEGVEINFARTATSRDAALSRLAVQLTDLDEGWIHAAGDPAGEWVVDLDQLRQRFPHLRQQQWMEGKRRVTPVFEVVQTTSSTGGTEASGVVSFILNWQESVTSKQRWSICRRIYAAINLTPGFGGLSLDLKKLLGRGRRAG